MSTLTGLIGGGGGGFGLKDLTNAQSGQSTAQSVGNALGGNLYTSVGGFNANTWETHLSLTNTSGYLLQMVWKAPSLGANTDNRMRASVDGTQIFNYRYSTNSSGGSPAIRVWPPFYEENMQSPLTLQQCQNTILPIRFESSLLVQGYKGVSTLTNYIVVGYVLD